MPITVKQLFEGVGITKFDQVMWYEVPDAKYPGVYLVSLNSNSENCANPYKTAPIAESSIRKWKNLSRTSLKDLEIYFKYIKLKNR